MSTSPSCLLQFNPPQKQIFASGTFLLVSFSPFYGLLLGMSYLSLSDANDRILPSSPRNVRWHGEESMHTPGCSKRQQVSDLGALPLLLPAKQLDTSFTLDSLAPHKLTSLFIPDKAQSGCFRPVSEAEIFSFSPNLLTCFSWLLIFKFSPCLWH